MFRPEDLHRIDAYDFVRRQPHRFLRGGEFDASEIASNVALEALLLGARTVRIDRDDQWVTISAEIDWLAAVRGNPFSELAPIPTVGRNAVTAEIVPVVFSLGVATATVGAGAVIVKGDSLGPLSEWRGEHGRAVAFRVEGEPSLTDFD